MMKRPLTQFLGIAFLLGIAGCDQSGQNARSSKSELADDNTPSFSLAWSDYPSWSLFGVAEELGYIDGAAGKIGPLEKQERVDIIAQQAAYDTCLDMFQSGACDAVCMTNVDALIASGKRDAVAVLPTGARPSSLPKALEQEGDAPSDSDSDQMPDAVVDMVVLGEDALQRPGADRFIKALMAVFYQVSDTLHGEHPEVVLDALKARQSDVSESEMREAVRRTQFYATPEDARDLMDSETFRAAMHTMQQLYAEKGLASDSVVEFGPVATGAPLRFDSSFLGTGD